ncbi:PadR family transcriptional regulator [Deinococcus hopiensis]|uniref:Transcriptional regulator, PadR family n=1 Tax=Deinococcus hopiensis KR-140 TaxID=695939 RepID=A0A1W1VPT3_9DEIO|nr:PadR family transcriptional regulator [Deinococcus hopiensis]SMB95283.1 transcriptional regulator, PadR family [Deinococcus hopiensis KR-140]
MSDASLGPASFIVLGVLAQCGPSTSYDLKREVDGSVGYFWSFPRSQLYAEPQRLTALGLLTETQEEGGRRRRTYALTDAGREALEAWLQAPAGGVELRDPGLLKLFFVSQGPPGVRQALASEQLSLHQVRLAEYERLASGPGGHALEEVQREPLGMGLLYERASLAFWQAVLRGEEGGSA